MDGPGQPQDLSPGQGDLELIEFHRYMIRIHKGLPCCEEAR